MGIYEKKWDIYRKKSKFVSCFFILGMPAVVLFCILVRWIFDVDLKLVFPFLLAAWAILWGYFSFELIRYPCPRCGMPFLKNQAPGLKNKRNCPACGLGLYEDEDVSVSSD